MGETHSHVTEATTKIDASSVLRLCEEFEKDRSIGVAADLVNSSFAVGRSELGELAAEFLLESKEKLPEELRELAEIVVDDQLDERRNKLQERVHPDRYNEISRARILLRSNFRNAIA